MIRSWKPPKRGVVVAVWRIAILTKGIQHDIAILRSNPHGDHRRYYIDLRDGLPHRQFRCRTAVYRGRPRIILWFRSYLKYPTEPRLILGPFLITVAGFGFHAIEQYLGHYGPAIG